MVKWRYTCYAIQYIQIFHKIPATLVDDFGWAESFQHAFGNERDSRVVKFLIIVVAQGYVRQAGLIMFTKDICLSLPQQKPEQPEKHF